MATLQIYLRISYKMSNENVKKKLTLIAMFSIPTISYGAYSVYFFVSNASKYTEMWRVFYRSLVS